MPKELNVEKLERKFASLTRSRESIQAVSSWILHHKDFYEDIVEEWFNSLSKDTNALVMFYVANEVIQNCGKKRVPQYREAFFKVLPKAVCLEKVKEIKSDVCRLLKLWVEREIYEEEFSQILENKLNNTEISSPPEEDVSELEIITNYKQENLINSLEKMKALESKIAEKEEILSYADEPLLPELDDLIVRKECIEMMKKIDSYYNLVEECLNITKEEAAVRKDTLKDLKHSSIFYTAQHKDVKKVANAYITFRKRLKVVEKKALEKKLTLPSRVVSDSPCFSEDNVTMSSSGCISPLDLDTSSVSRNSAQIITGNEKDQDDVHGTGNLNIHTSFLGQFSKGISLDYSKNVEKKSEEVSLSVSKHAPKQQFNKLTELLSEIKPGSDKLTGHISDEISKSTSPQDKTASDSSLSIPGLQVSPNEQSDKLPDPKSNIVVDQQTDLPKSEITHFSGDKPSISNQQDEAVSNTDTTSTSDQLVENSYNQETTKNTPAEGYVNEIDILLDQSYDNKKSKSNIDIKRKIELLLSSKGKKICTDVPTDQSFENTPPVPIESPAGNPSIKRKHHDDQTDIILVETCTSEEMTKNKKRSRPVIEKDVLISEKLANCQMEKPFTDLEITENNEKSSVIKKEPKVEQDHTEIASISDFVQNSEKNLPTDKSNASDLCLDVEPPELENTNTNDFNLDSKVSKDGDSSIKAHGTFFGSNLFSSISSLSTELLKSILEKNKFNSTVDIKNDNILEESSLGEVKINFPKQNDSDNFDASSKDSIKNTIPTNLDNVALIEKKCSTTNTEIGPLLQTKNVIENVIDIKVDNSNSSFEGASINPADFQQITNNDNNSSKQELPSLKCEPEENSFNSNHETVTLDEDSKSKLPDPSATIINDKKPNLLLILQNMLKCISERKLSHYNVKNLHSKAAEQDTPMPLENCLRVYQALQCADSSYACGSNLSKLNLIKPTTVASANTSNSYNQDNLEVMDMECDSEDEQIN